MSAELMWNDTSAEAALADLDQALALTATTPDDHPGRWEGVGR